MENITYDSFISYSSHDKEIAFTVCNALEKKGIKCWIAPRNVEAGHYPKSIVNGIKNSKALIVILSSNSNSSTPVLNELELATNNNLLIIPLRIEDIFPTESMEYYTRLNNWFDVLSPKSENDFEDFVNMVDATIKHKRSSSTITLSTKVIDKSKSFSFKSFTFIVSLLLIVMIAINIQQSKLINQQQKFIEQFNKLKEEHRNNPKEVSQAEHIKDIAGYKEAIKYFNSINKKLFYANYEDVTIDLNNPNSPKNPIYIKYTLLTTRDNLIKLKEYILNIKTIPRLSKIKISNSSNKPNNYNIQISAEGYKTKNLLITMNKDINIMVKLDLISGEKKLKE